MPDPTTRTHSRILRPRPPLLAAFLQGYASSVYKAFCKRSGELVCLKAYDMSALCELNRFQIYRSGQAPATPPGRAPHAQHTLPHHTPLRHTPRAAHHGGALTSTLPCSCSIH